MILTLAELIEKRKALASTLLGVTGTARVEKRKLSDDELSKFTEGKAELIRLDNEIRNKPGVPPINPKTKMKQPAFSLLRAIRSAAEGTAQDEIANAVIAAGREELRKSNLPSFGSIIIPSESRAIIASGAVNSGQEGIAEEKLDFVGPLRAALVTVQAGATFLTGLVGDISIPLYAGTNALWKGETAAATDGAGATSEVNLAPKRLTTYIDISKMFLAQDSTGAEAMLMADIVTAVAQKLEATIFGKEAGSATQPAGFFATAPTIAGAASWDNVVALETAVDTANALAGNLAYITNSAARGILKTTPKESTYPEYLLDNGELNGYKTLVTNNVATDLQTGVDEEGIVFGNWADYLIGQWGAIDLTVDPYTQAVNGVVRVTVNAYFDAKPKRAESFKTGSLK